MTSETEAHSAMLAHHRALAEGMETRVGALAGVVAAGSPPAAAVAELVAFLATEVLPHARAEEETIYRVAAARDDLAQTVTGMIAEHGTLATAAGRLTSADDGRSALLQAKTIAALFTAHVAKENEILLPALLADPAVDLADLLTQMHHSMEAAAQPAPSAGADSDSTTGTLLTLLLDAASALARAGEGDQACRITAAAWAALREPRPDLAVRVTAALHGLARRAAAGPAAEQPAAELTMLPRPGAGPQPDSPDLDVRQLAPAQRHEAIFAAWRALAPGAGFVLINDHDPKPLRYQFEAEHTGEFSWRYLEEGPEVWRVHIGRPAFTDGHRIMAGTSSAPAGAQGAAAGEPEPELDVRTIAHFQRHDVIFSTYRALAPGAGFVIVNDHDPRPLRYQFEAQYAGDYTWDYLTAGPELWRVRIGRPAAAAAG